MRKLIITITAVFAVAGLGTAAATAAADVPGASHYPTFGGGVGCATPPLYGDYVSLPNYPPLYGGFYHDGCTAVITCRALVCSYKTVSRIDPEQRVGIMFSQNARVRLFNTAGTEVWHHDTSCYRAELCGTTDTVVAKLNETVTIQCNGMHY